MTSFWMSSGQMSVVFRYRDIAYTTIGRKANPKDPSTPRKSTYQQVFLAVVQHQLSYSNGILVVTKLTEIFETALIPNAIQ